MYMISKNIELNCASSTIAQANDAIIVHESVFRVMFGSFLSPNITADTLGRRTHTTTTRMSPAMRVRRWSARSPTTDRAATAVSILTIKLKCNGSINWCFCSAVNKSRTFSTTSRLAKQFLKIEKFACVDKRWKNKHERTQSTCMLDYCYLQEQEKLFAYKQEKQKFFKNGH